MKFLASFLILAMLAITNSITAQNKITDTKTITVTVVNATSDAGKIGFALYTKDNFMRKPVQSKEGKIKDGKSTVVFENILSGEYAIICYHDKNNNDKNVSFDKFILVCFKYFKLWSFYFFPRP